MRIKLSRSNNNSPVGSILVKWPLFGKYHNQSKQTNESAEAAKPSRDNLFAIDNELRRPVYIR